MTTKENPVRRLVKRLVPLRRRNAIRLAMKRHPFELRSRWPELSTFGLSKGDVIFDVGANVGDFTECVLAHQPWAIIHAFEPVPKAFELFRRKFHDYKDIYYRNVALGSKQGQKLINVSHFVEASSFLENGSLLSNRVYGIDFTVTETLPVEVETMTSYCRQNSINRIKLLKLDVQGYELEVLKGAEAVLDSVQFIYAEAQFQELYENGPLFQDLYVFLHQRQFELVQMTSFRADDDGRLMECDMIFRSRGVRG